MSKLTQELTPERADEIAGRVLRRRAAVAALPAPTRTETTHRTRRQAEAAASRVGIPNTEVGAVETTHGWVGVVRLRPDQGWARSAVEERGCRAGEVL